MVFKDDLTQLVTRYADFKELSGHYEKKPEVILDDDFRRRMEGELIQLISKHLILGAADYKEITKRFKQFSMVLHPDKINNSPMLAWLEDALSIDNTTEGGHCFKLLTLCYERLNPEHKKNIEFDEIKNMDDLKRWLKQQKDKSSSRTQANLYACLLQMVKQMSLHGKDSQEVQQRFLKVLMLQLPIYVSSFCAYIFAEELMAVYGVCFVALKVGERLQSSETQYWREFGQKMQEVSYSTTHYTTSLVARVLEISYWLTNQSYHTGLAIASSVLRPMLDEHQQTARAEVSEEEAIHAIVPRDPANRRYPLETIQLQNVANPLEEYLHENAEQWFKPLRAGGLKRQAFKQALTDLQEVDSATNLSVNEKLADARGIIQSLIDDSVVYGTGINAQVALNSALLTLEYYSSSKEEESRAETTTPQM